MAKVKVTQVKSLIDLAVYEFQYKVISTRLFVGKRIIHVYAEEQPDPSFEPMEANLEDVYFATLN